MHVTRSQWINLGIFGLFVVLFLHAIEDPDIWYHLTIGRAVFESGTVPAKEFYVFTRLGQASEFHEWGFGLLYYLIYSLGGFTGMILANALLGALTVYLLFATAQQRGHSLAAAFIAALVGFWLMEFRFVQRPENLLYLALAATLFCMEKYRSKGDWRWLGIIPLIGFLLSQCHPSSLMLVLVMGTYLVEAIARRRPDKRQALQLVGAILLTAAVALLNPYGLKQLILPISFSLQTELLNSITEFLPALATSYAYRFVIGVLLVGFCLLGVRRRFSLAEWLMLIAFAFLAYQHARNIALLGIALVLPLATAIEQCLKPRAVQFATACLCLVAIAFDSSQQHRLSLDVDPTGASLKGAETIARLTPAGNILNFYHLGNYLAWRLYGTHKVLIDGRNFQDNFSLGLHDDLLSARGNWRQLLDRYGIVAIVTPVTLPYSGEFVPLVFKLANDPEWALVDREPAGLVFVRRSAAPKRDWLPEQEIWLQAKEELTMNLAYYPDSGSSRQSLAEVKRQLAQPLP